ncbi:hypothetical protein IJG44_00320 [bacterium]|nr:hypothetical protein [bacterium]
MKRFLNLSVVLLVFLVFSCSSSHSSTDSDVIPDTDTDSQDSEIVDDSNEISYHDSDSPEPSEEIFEETKPINGYARCYDKIPAGDYEGFFADPNIESQIKKSLGYEENYELTAEDLEKITEITLSAKDLRGVEKLINLEYVRFKDTEGNIYDFTPLSNLKKLKKVVIYFRPPAELDPSEHHENMTCLDGSFSLLTTLETLKIENTHLKKIDPIEQLVNLKTLEIDHNKIESLPKNIGNLQKLERLTFSYNNIVDLKHLISLTNLNTLAFANNQVEDVSPIKNMTKMSIINFSENNIKDISAIENFSELKSLGANDNKIETLPDFKNFEKLQYIYLDFNNISSLPNLKGLNSLDEMWLAYNNLNDEEFGKLDELEYTGFLDVSFNKITKVPVLKNLKSLKYMLLVGNEISDLSGFADNESFPALKQLDLQYNKIENAEPLRKRKKLSRLSIYNNCIKDISPLEELQENGTHVSGIDKQLESCENK